MTRIMVPFNWSVAPHVGQTKNSGMGNPSLPPPKRDSVHFGTAKAFDVTAIRWREFFEILNDEVDFRYYFDRSYRDDKDKFNYGDFQRRCQFSSWANGIDVDQYINDHAVAFSLLLHILGPENFKALSAYGTVPGLKWAHLPVFVGMMEGILQGNSSESIDILVQATQLCEKMELPASSSDPDISQLTRDLERLQGIISVVSSIHAEPDKTRKNKGKRLLAEAVDAPHLDLKELLVWRDQPSRFAPKPTS